MNNASPFRPPSTDALRSIPASLVSPDVTLRRAFAFFVRQPSPRALLILLAGTTVARLLFPIWSWADLWVALSILAFWPVQEWIVHSHSLHLKPFSIGRLRVDPVQAKNHRAHHDAPWRADVLFVYPGVYKYAVPLLLMFWWLVTRRWNSALTGTVFYLAVVARYEWTHLLIHTGYRGRSAYFRRQRTHHLAHHFRNDNYWFGVTSSMADRLLRTAPSITSVPITEECARVTRSPPLPCADPIAFEPREDPPPTAKAPSVGE